MLIFLIGLLLLPFANAAAGGVEVGASFGGIRATIGGSSPKGSSFGPRGSGSAGVSIAYRVTRDVALLFEPGYTVLGAVVEVDSVSVPEKQSVLDVRLPYIVFPVGVRVSSSGGRAFVIGELEPRVLQQADAELLIDPGTTVDITDRVKSFDLAMNMGAGYAFPWKPLRFSLEARYSQGLLNIDDGVSKQVDVPFPNRFRTNGLGLVLRVMIPLSSAAGEGDAP